MKCSSLPGTFLFAVLIFAFSQICWAQDGASLYRQRCAVCHEGGASDRAPDRTILQYMPAASIVRTLETGVMREMAGSLTPAQRDAIAAFLTANAPRAKSDAAPRPSIGLCPASSKSFSIEPGAPQWNGWSPDLSNHRFQPAAIAGMSATDVPRLKLKWAFGFEGDYLAFSQPSIVAGNLFVGSQQGKVFSLDAGTGCLRWSFQADTAVRTAVTIGLLSGKQPPNYAAFFGDQRGGVYAVDAATGHLLWKVQADSHPQTRITGSPQFFRGRVYVPVSSAEEVASIDPHYECCRFRGSVVALDAQTGAQVWKTYLIDQAPHPTTKSALGTQFLGPSGVAIWCAPTLDPEHKVLYVGTGNNYSDPAVTTSDAILALDMDTGKLLWSRQLTPDDAYNSSCRTTFENCPKSKGPDFDFGSSPILVSLPGGHRALVAGQKSGVVYALDPDNGGKVLWQVRVGEGGVNGGVQWGSAADEDNAYVALSDVTRTRHETTINGQKMVTRTLDPFKGGGLFAVRLASGEKAWQTLPSKSACQDRPNCSPSQSSAVTAIPGAVFSGAMDGHLRAYSATDGHIVWDFDAVRDFTTVNGVPARGGAFDGPGPAIVGGILYVNSGYGRFGAMPGNVLLAFSVDGK
jgi:polyvinyl alcohol dehydrogenase (cytochrome)